MEEEIFSPLQQKMNEIYEKGFLYIPGIKSIPNTVHKRLLIGGKAYIDKMWSDIHTQIISIIFKEIPTLEFLYHLIEPMQKDLEEEFGDNLAHYDK